MGAISAAPLTGAKGRNRQMVPKWAELTLRECKAGYRTSRALRNDKVLKSKRRTG